MRIKNKLIGLFTAAFIMLSGFINPAPGQEYKEKSKIKREGSQVQAAPKYGGNHQSRYRKSSSAHHRKATHYNRGRHYGHSRRYAHHKTYRKPVHHYKKVKITRKDGKVERKYKD